MSIIKSFWNVFFKMISDFLSVISIKRTAGGELLSVGIVGSVGMLETNSFQSFQHFNAFNDFNALQEGNAVQESPFYSPSWRSAILL